MKYTKDNNYGIGVPVKDFYMHKKTGHIARVDTLSVKKRPIDWIKLPRDIDLEGMDGIIPHNMVETLVTNDILRSLAGTERINLTLSHSAMKQLIAMEIDSGMSKSQIVDQLIRRYTIKIDYYPT